MNLENKTNSAFYKMGVVACAGIMAFSTACKNGRNAPNKVNISAQKHQHVLQPVDFDILDKYGNVYDSYRHVIYAQSKNMRIEIPEGGSLQIINGQKSGKYIEDVIFYTRTNRKLSDKKGKSAFRDKVNIRDLGLKAGDNGRMTFGLEWGLEIPSSMEIPYVISPEPEPQPEPTPPVERPKPKQERTVRIPEPVEEQPQPQQVRVVYFQREYVVARPAGGFGLFFGFSSVRRVPYPVMGPGPMMGVGCVPYRPPMNYCPPQRQGIQRSPIHRSSLGQNAPRVRQVTRSSLQYNARSARSPSRNAVIRRK